MKKLLFIFILIGNYNAILGQEYHSMLRHNEWDIKWFSWGDNSCFNIKFEELWEETNQLVGFLGQSNYAVLEDFDEQTVTFQDMDFPEIPPRIIYDFTLEEGDNFQIQINNTITENLVVTEVDYIPSPIGNLKRIRLTGNIPFGDMIWIEGIGCTWHPLYPTLWITDPSYQVIKVEKNNQVIYEEGTACFTSVNRIDNTFINVWYHNQQIHLEKKGFVEIKEVKLFNALGQKMTLLDQPNFPISLDQDLNVGLYILTVGLDNGKDITFKFFKD